ncbi:LPPG:FO 2-phospho-L-lactate transferase, F420 biosynthesis enzyme [Halanaeroarchaeum sp. HSR-CO]|uniref:2-phospho-L-lactate transferase n=1 Tax=Halanaeroarchaeum sp. HSR-CO TaxID=2866382 RepID=UPI00217D21FE|nr:2-phospho-L-lactate transferase [Halanaeroarchaeum sp. HSR-CO]UWG48525.1 LPPG:FO 2-phospho-L-lactate transferase, F420 biosynthesis enzyme [Halanaeroarchaeum sp. HSR-CO]
MTVFLAGGTGTPKLLSGAEDVIAPADTTVVGNTGDDVELGGLFVCPDIDTVLYERAEELDRDRWWGIADDPTTTHDEIVRLSAAVDIPATPRYLPDDRQTDGRDIARWRRFSAAGEFMHIGDRDRAVHLLRTSLLDEGRTLTEVTRTLADAFGLLVEVVPMSDDPVATIVHTAAGPMHFQEFWVARGGEPAIESVEFRGSEAAQATATVLEAIREGPVVVGPSNPVTSIGPMLALDGIEAALHETSVVAVSPFVEDKVFSGPARDLMEAVGYEPSTAGVADAYPFADAFVLDDADGTDLDRPVVRTDTTMDDRAAAERVARAVGTALEGI